MKPCLFFIFVVVTLCFVAWPHIVRAQKNIDMLHAIGDAKQSGLAMTDFESKFGHYPNTQIPEELQAHYPQTNRTDSNYILGQLIVADCTDSESIFDTLRSRNPSSPDDIKSPLAELLRAGECELSCVTLVGDQPLSSAYSHSATPLLFNHILPGTDRFDPHCYNGRMVYLREDYSVTTADINSDGKAFLKGTNKTLFETGPETVWGDKTPILHHPLFYEVSAYSAPPKKWPLPVAGVSFFILSWFLLRRSSKKKKLIESVRPSA